MIIDITHPIHPGLAVWPGDTPYSHKWVMRMGDAGGAGDSVNVSTLTMSAHTGTHADAPLHFLPQGETIGALPLEPYIGPAQVVALPKTGPIQPQDLASFDLALAPRLLVRSPVSARDNTATPAPVSSRGASFPAPLPSRGALLWSEDIAYPTPETIDLLASRGIILFGTDSPSVDPIQSKTLDAHHRLAHHGMAILENLALSAVEPGLYELIALPLSLPVDGSPVRAVLRTLP